jgi:hypothetical protein
VSADGAVRSADARFNRKESIMNDELLRKRGFTDHEIETIAKYCNEKQKAGEFNNRARLWVHDAEKKDIEWISATVAEAVLSVRPNENISK